MAIPTASIRLPGFGKPLNVRDGLKYDRIKTQKFPLALIDEYYRPPNLPVREYMIMELVNTITDKPNWQQKVLDETIVAKWRTEVLGSDSPEDHANALGVSLAADRTTDTHETEDEPTSPGSDSNASQWSAYHAPMNISPKMFDWAIAEVRYKAELFKRFDCVEALDGVWKSDTIVGEDLRKALEKAVEPLEDVPADKKDWHPGSNSQVLDLVHPSIYPLVYGQSQILEDQTCNLADSTSMIGKGKTIHLPEEATKLDSEWSKKFQWLPAEFEAPEGTEDVHVRSYINNLHPNHHQDLYSIIAQIVAKAIPLWNRALSHLIAPRTTEFRVTDWSNSDCGYGEAESEEPRKLDTENDGDYFDRLEVWRDTRPIIQPEAGEFKTPAERLKIPQSPDIEPLVNLRGNGGRMQIIVKLANIHLTPEKPEYLGGSWHVEGQANESICASALYYYSSHNITPSHLSLRQQTDDGEDLPYPQDDFRALGPIYGITNSDPKIQNLGRILTSESRLLCFPNVMQHRVSPFRLTDPSQPGHRKLLALFLVDPHIKIISTENIPPQQLAWWKETVERAGIHQKLPPELADMVLHGTEFPVSLKKAGEQRLELMEERKGFKRRNEEVVREWTFSLCEH